jgi:MFS family permease
VRERNFRLLLAGHGLGTVAQLVLTLAVGIDVLERTSSGVWVSVTVALGFAPYVIFSGYAGLLADRWSRSVVLTWSFLTRAGCAALLASGLLLGWAVPLLVSLAAAAAVLATPAFPALAAATPECVPDEQLSAANALVIGVENVTWMAGPGVLGLILLSGNGPASATILSAALFLAAGFLAARVRLARPPRPQLPAGAIAELVAGLRTVVTRESVRRPMTVAVIDNFLYGYLVVAMVLLAESLLGGERTVGWLNAGLSVGAVASMVVVNRLAANRNPVPALSAVMAVFAFSTVLIGWSVRLPLTVGLVTVAGASTLIAEVMAVTMLQQAAPTELAARVFGVYDQLSIGAIATGSLIAGPLAERLGPDIAIVVVGGVCLLLSLLVTARMRARRRGPRHLAPRS